MPGRTASFGEAISRLLPKRREVPNHPRVTARRVDRYQVPMVKGNNSEPADRAAAPDDRTAPPRPPDDERPDPSDLDAYVASLVDAAPPLTPEQRDRLALLFSIRIKRHRPNS